MMASTQPDSPVERIRHNLVGLRMPRALEALEGVIQQLERGQVGALEAIDTLLAEEITVREGRRIKAALQMARLATIKTHPFQGLYPAPSSDGSGQRLSGGEMVWTSPIERFEHHAPASVMARTALEHALPAEWIDAMFDAHRKRQCPRELLFSTVVELVSLVSLGLRPSLHAAARQMPTLPVSLTALYDKVNHTEPGILRALVRGSAERVGPVAAAVHHDASLPG